MSQGDIQPYEVKQIQIYYISQLGWQLCRKTDPKLALEQLSKQITGMDTYWEEVNATKDETLKGFQNFEGFRNLPT